MGARHILDLTSDVTHLVCGGLYSPKYRYVSKMRPEVKVMSTKWVDAMYAQWIAGEDIDPRTFEMEHRFPILYGIRLSVTGVADGMIYTLFLFFSFLFFFFFFFFFSGMGEDVGPDVMV
jgi:DNA replication regulator DPB11